VLGADGRAVVSRRAAGRGAWLCIPPGPCFELAVRRNGFQRAWRRPVGDEAVAELGELLSQR
jgi:predicted RNA-binding protein YlxR (DUF448 family)